MMRDKDKLRYRVDQLLTAVQLCIEQQLELPGLILVYSTMDTLGWLYSNDPNAHISDNFKRWVSGYMTNRGVLRCTPDDLWGARCALLHTFTPDSKLSTRGRARKLCYAWGDASVSDLHALIDGRPGMAQRYVAVHVNELVDELKKGIERFLVDLDGDPQLATRVYERSNRFYADLSKEILTRA